MYTYFVFFIAKGCFGVVRGDEVGVDPEKCEGDEEDVVVPPPVEVVVWKCLQVGKVFSTHPAFE